MAENLYEVARQFFNDVNTSSNTREELGKFNQKFEFEVADDDPFTLTIENAEISLNQGITGPENFDAIRFMTGREVLLKLFSRKMRFTDAYTHMRERDTRKAIGRLYVREIPGVGGTDGGVLVRWLARLIRMGQELPLE